MSRHINKVLEIFSAPKGANGGIRPKVQKLTLVENHGIIGDKFADKDLEKTVMIVGINSYKLAESNEISMNYGSLGENILLNFDPHILPIGTVLKINEAKIEITQKCTICSHLAEFGKILPELLKDCRGLYCKVINDGEITKNSIVDII